MCAGGRGRLENMTPIDSPLCSIHRELGAQLVEFAGWRLPLQFGSVAAEVRACRQSAALFDISHMGLVRLRGDGARTAISRLLTRAVTSIPLGCASYALLLNESGGILDDLFVMVESDAQVLLVVNAVNHEKDVAWVRQHLGAEAGVQIEDPRGATFGLALQGPEAKGMVTRVTPGQEPPMLFATLQKMEIGGADVLVSRTGYTGEDGFEVFGESGDGINVWRALMAPTGGHGNSRPTAGGLAARDVLRQEMGYPLWGNDLDEDTTPAEAGLQWAVNREHEFVGRAALEGGERTRRRVGFVVEGQGVARAGDVIAWKGEAVGTVTSGTYSHNLQAAIGQGYVKLHPELVSGATVEIAGRGRALPARLARMPLIPAQTRPSWRSTKETTP